LHLTRNAESKHAIKEENGAENERRKENKNAVSGTAHEMQEGKGR
jgi:hypothetical protein